MCRYWGGSWMWTWWHSRNLRKWNTKILRALAHTWHTYSRRQRSWRRLPLRSPATPPAALVPHPLPWMNNSSQGLRPLAPFLCIAARDSVTVLLDIIACVFCITPHHASIEEPSAKIILMSSSSGYPKPLEHVQPQQTKAFEVWQKSIYQNKFGFQQLERWNSRK